MCGFGGDGLMDGGREGVDVAQCDNGSERQCGRLGEHHYCLLGLRPCLEVGGNRCSEAGEGVSVVLSVTSGSPGYTGSFSRVDL